MSGVQLSKANDRNRLGYHVALATTALTAVTFAIAILTPPLSGPMCAGNCFAYPYLDIASRFPRDYVWMYFAIGQAAVYLILMACVHEYAAPIRKPWSLAGLCFSTIAAGTLITTYFSQLAVIQPSLLRGESDGISLLTQFNPHGLFIALEEVGYLMMAISFFLIGPVFVDAGKSGRILRWVLQGGFIGAIVALGLVAVKFGHSREYLFEIAIISIDWLVLLVSSIFMARIFKAEGSPTLWRHEPAFD